MAKLKVDLDVLQATIGVYNTEIAHFVAAKASIVTALNALKSSGWKSDASRAWFSLLDDEWLKNIDFQIRVLKSLRDDLVIANNEYEGVYDEQCRLQNYL